MQFYDEAENVVDDDMLELLLLIAKANPYYGPLSQDNPEYQRLLKLEQLGYVRYCGYPEEWWVILPAGKTVLKMGAR